MPKSAIFTRPSASSITFPGFTSRWTIPRSCAWSSARATSAPIAAASSGQRPGLEPVGEGLALD